MLKWKNTDRKYIFSAEDYIINDPNGLVYYKGEYHLFHQYNINEQIYWGHAVSKDLVRWKRLPKAIAPDKIGQIWSGSAVVDEENQRMVAFLLIVNMNQRQVRE